MDMQVYAILLNAAYDILKRNSQQINGAFAEEFMACHDSRGGQRNERYIRELWNYASAAAQRLNGSAEFRNNEQMFDVVGSYIKDVYSGWLASQNRGNSGPGFGGFNQGSSMGFNSGSGFGGGGMFNNNRGGGFGFNQQPQRPMGGSHLADDTSQNRSQQPQQQAPQPIATGSVSFAPIPVPEASVAFSLNPLDDFPEKDNGLEFVETRGRLNWAEEHPRDRRIVLSRKIDFKTRDPRFQVMGLDMYHQLILDNPLDVAKDFFATVPDSTLAKSFVARVYYNHLKIIDVPTKDFKEIRDKCIQAVKQDSSTPLWRKVSELLDSMQRGPYKAMTTYLVDHLNRALHLACRITSNPQAYVKIGEVDDLQTILSSSWHNELIAHPDGRHRLEKIVGSAIWNAIAMNSSLMFTDGSIPTHAIQSSPVFPFSMEGVYPNKFSIPADGENHFEDFMKRLEEHELTTKSYVLSRRSVVITNILGKHVLPRLSKDPQIFNNSVAGILSKYSLPFSRSTIEGDDLAGGDVTPNVLESYPSEQLDSYYTDEFTAMKETEIYERKEPCKFPVDQTFFAIQYGESPLEYLAAFDVMSATDGQMTPSQVMLAKKHMPILKPTV